MLFVIVIYIGNYIRFIFQKYLSLSHWFYGKTERTIFIEFCLLSQLFYN
jgi:hypothetical protein